MPTSRAALAPRRGILAASVGAWVDHRAASKGAALAFYTLFSMAPILLLALAGAGYFFDAEVVRVGMVAKVRETVGRDGAQAIEALLLGARDPAASLTATLVAAVLMLLGSGAVFVELKGSLDEIWGAAPPKGRAVIGFLRTQLHSFGLVLVLGFLLLVSLTSSMALGVLELHVDGLWRRSAWLLSAAAWVLSFGVTAALFAVIYKVLPDAPLTWLDASVGALLTAVLFSAGKVAIALYLGHSAVASGFGAAGSVIALLLWVYYSSLVFFLGAEFTRQYSLRGEGLAEPAAS